ncbi:OadG family protein [Treponema socranskii]|uniref:OadG family protein n=1 Tax=Treponema socranskii TaxID=53419 RepID=UPI0028ED4A3C|nr:OadG family protein [Treponema socranskii]
MTIAEMLQQSGILTLLGMGVVFSFLIIMILCMYLLHVVLRALKLDKEEKKETAQSPAPVPVRHNDAIIAAIAAAVHK